jgi:hypothetical protein
MSKRRTWDELEHAEKIEKLKFTSIDDLVDFYRPQDVTEASFMAQLAQEIELWKPEDIGEKRTAGGPPKKELFLGAMRDLNRAEALLELVDNSIDVWMKRRDKYSNRTAPQLQIYIDLYESSGLLIYEDNAGGVPEKKLDNLVIPGFSETADLDHTIGSYRTGGKKAIFKLATEANIKTYYWNPVGTSDEAFEIHLDKKWIHDSQEYEFPYFPIKNIGDLHRGQTIYVLRLRDADWDQSVYERIEEEIRRTYTLLMLRNPDIEIYFNDRSKPLEPIADLYKFTGAVNRSKKIDIRPIKVNFNCQVEWEEKSYDVVIEVIWGCRTTTAARKDGDAGGIDLYGNNRLFVHHDQNQMFRWVSNSTAQARQYLRGLINIHGPNVLVPWDTHKRHLNEDSPIIAILKRKPISDLFNAWNKVYSALSGNDELRDLIKQPIQPWKVEGDLNVAASQDIAIAPPRSRRKTPSVIEPKVPENRKASSNTTIELKVKVSKAEFRELCENFKIKGSSEDREIRQQLADAIKEAAKRMK